MKFRKAKIGDAKEISILRKNTIKKVNGWNLKKEEIIYLMNRNNPKIIMEKIKKRDMFCLISNKKIIGTVDLHDGEIGSVYVHYKFVRKGIGTKIMDFIEDYAKKKGIKVVHLKSAKQAKSFYLKRGYKLIKKIKNDKGLVNFYMEKKLK
ncbi:MAG: GNAT family N-acetyltransferase [Nanoarchaeota archaeon]